MTVKITVGDTRDVLKTFADGTFDMCVTSPPFFNLRDYQTGTWEGGDATCDHVERNARGDANNETPGGRGGSFRGGVIQFTDKCGKCGAERVDHQIGREKSPDEYVAKMVEVFREVRRVIKPDGTLWLNLGDSYAASGNGGHNPSSTFNGHAERPGDQTGVKRKPPVGYKAKDLIGIPWMTAFALRADGWYLRQWMPWVKRNPMPESVEDRPTSSCEMVFLLTKSADCYYDYDAIRRGMAASSERRFTQDIEEQAGSLRVNGMDPLRPGKVMKAVRPKRADKRRGHSRRHAGFNERWDAMSVKEQGEGGRAFRNTDLFFDSLDAPHGAICNDEQIIALDIATHAFKEAHFATFPPKLIEPMILAGSRPGGIVLDPFGGAGTTGLVADRLQRHAHLIELNPSFADIARRRIVADASLFSEVV